jgi:hypothetical protein
MSIDHHKLGQLQYVFPKLTQTNQQYILGLTEGLNHAQKCLMEQEEGKEGHPQRREKDKRNCNPELYEG